jgi:hypothetical protein
VLGLSDVRPEQVLERAERDGKTERRLVRALCAWMGKVREGADRAAVGNGEEGFGVSVGSSCEEDQGKPLAFLHLLHKHGSLTSLLLRP